jgi:hypothetical protein
MKKRILPLVITFLILLGIQIPVEARVLIKDGVPQVSDVKIDTYIADNWSAYPDYHVQNASPSIWASQLNTGPNSNTNCVPATAKMLLNMKGLMKEKSVEAISSEGLNEVNNYTMLDYLKSSGYSGKFISGGSDIIKRYLDWGNVITVPTLEHQRLCIGYATRNDKTWFEVLDPDFTDSSKGHQWIEENQIAIGFAITDTNKVIPFTVDYKDNNGNSKQAIAYYNSLDYFLPKSMINEMLPETLNNEKNFKESVLSTMNYQEKAQDTITNLDKLSKEYMYIGNTIYQKYEFTNDSQLQKENNTIIRKSINGVKNAA